MGDRVSIQLSFEGKTVAAQAEVPRYPVDEMVIQPSGIADINYITGGHWLYVMPVQAELPFTADFTALRVIAGNKDHQCWVYCSYSRYLSDKFFGDENITMRTEISFLLYSG